MTMFHLLKIRTSIDMFENEKCRVTFGLEYIYSGHFNVSCLKIKRTLGFTIQLQVLCNSNPVQIIG